MNFLLAYTEVAIQTKEVDLLIRYVKEGKEPVTLEIFIGLAKLQQEGEKQKVEEEKKQHDQIKKIATDKIVEEEKLKAEKETKKQQEEQAFFRILEEFNVANNARWEVEIDEFVPELQ